VIVSLPDDTLSPLEEEGEFARYAKQMRFAPLGLAGQRGLASASVLLCGCGALGGTIAATLVRAGVGRIRIVDRDFLELSNLQRQSLYDEDDLATGEPKAILAQRKLARMNSQVTIEAEVADVDHTNIGRLVRDVQLILDGTDNFDTRFLLNDASLHYGIPWIYGGCLGAEGQTLVVLPGKTPCLRCLLDDTPGADATATCDSAGILAPAIQIVASLQAMEAIKLLAGAEASVNRHWTVFNVWENAWRSIKLHRLLEEKRCPACHARDFPWLRGERGSHTAVLCGRNAVQLTFPGREPLSLPLLAQRLGEVGSVTLNRFLLRLTVPPYVLTVFPEGRAMVQGTENIAEARSVYSRYVGM
jgi:adenylyltransferase/sulfurtransferase